MGKAEIEAAQAILGITPTQPGSAIGGGVVIICVDCEAYEFAQHKITEIGISVLDTRTLRDLSPTDSADQWFSKIASRHFRINEYAHLVNKKYIKGKPETFAFGTSTFIDKKDAVPVLNRIFEGPAVTDTNGVATKVVVIGHGLKNDTKFLFSLGFKWTAIPNIVRRLDTQSLVGSKKDNVGLSRLLRVLGIEVKEEHLHNAGNDAAYTLQAFVLTALREHAAPGSISGAIHQQRVDAAAARAVKQATLEAKNAITEAGVTDQDSTAPMLPPTVVDGSETSMQPSAPVTKSSHTQVRSMDDYGPTVKSRRQEKLMRRAERLAAKAEETQNGSVDGMS